MVKDHSVSQTWLAIRCSPQTISHMLDFLPQEAKKALSLLLAGMHERLFIKLTVEELLWGYEDEVLKIISKFVTIPGMPDGKFGFLVDVSHCISLL